MRTSARPAAMGYAAAEPTGSPASRTIRRRSRVGSAHLGSVAVTTTGTRVGPGSRHRGHNARVNRTAHTRETEPTGRTAFSARASRAVDARSTRAEWTIGRRSRAALGGRTESHGAARANRTVGDHAARAGRIDRAHRTSGGTARTHAGGVVQAEPAEPAERATRTTARGNRTAIGGRTENHRAAGVGHHRAHPTRHRAGHRPVVLGRRRERAEPQTTEIHTRELDGERAGHLLDPRGWSNVLRCSPLGH